ncbi:70c514b8-d18e-4d6f-9bf4-1db0f35ad1e3 [Sclerotinia trifoliorum]|uniref:70c514b8-d18e-4d6f-9bf4-1db0f35ad1e3 n=1 Tax=Sclerotinia trifoliorum TaxID=28548 RepID=A0A8H2ZSX0_9HELO|nr:70c514b8-d18e-4d6f-9bf4-1db0f35ad1e3 [Sclerotinia trifoliorum]
MATAPMTTDPSRLSFAKVAASAGKDNVALASFAKIAASSTAVRDTKLENIAPTVHGSKNTDRPSATSNDIGTTTHKETVAATNDQTSKSGTVAKKEPDLVETVKAMHIRDTTPSLVVNGSGIAPATHKRDLGEGFPDDPFQRTESGSDLGTKPPSLDGKSITSGTTFALDEKESLRPDDSASVKAAEDDDTFSGRGSIVAGSRIGSEAAARAYRAQFYEAPDRRSIQLMQERQTQGIVTPQSGSSGQQTTDDKSKPLVGPAGSTEAFTLFYRQTPDEKLLEALESPKDRIFLLRLEQDVIEFVKDSKEPFIDLPPCNSFCRMLTHKLADYYHMTHQVDAVVGAVRIFRTPFCRIPPSLTSISNPPTTGNTPPPNLPAMKIMRRGGDGDTGLSPSKATSETGSEAKEKAQSAKEKLSREEREAVYLAARERIFGKEDKSGDATPETEEGNEMSRSSSVSTKDKGKRGKVGKQRRDDSESFDVRSQYTPYFPQQQAQPAWIPTQNYTAMGVQQYNGVMPNNYQNQMQPQFVPPPQPFNPAMMNNGNMQSYNNMPPPQFPPQNQPRYQPHSAPITTYGTPAQSPQPPQQWIPQNQYPSAPYQSRGPVTGGPPNTIPYAFGQLPSTANPADPKSQHPIPGSFINRHAFNPKTQSFVPGNQGLPIPQPMSHHGSPHHGSPHHGSPHLGSPHLSYSNFSPPQQQYGAGMGYSMARQGSNNSLPSYHASPHMAHRPMMHQNMPQNHPQGLPQAMPHGMPQGMPQGPLLNGQVGSHLPNFGNPATLPPKPPTGV